VVLCDTNILSSFARVGALELLFKLFPQRQFALPQAVHNEIAEAIRLNFKFLESVLTLIASGKILVIVPNPEEEQDVMNLPKSFGPGESEAVAICARRSAILLSNDKSVKNYCRTHGIEVYDLQSLLRALWQNKVASRHKVQKIVGAMERLEGLVFKNKERIFKR
jgi:predicted nucleic acid-binding protein